METIEYEIEISADAQTIWKLLWEKDSYRDWTQFFSPGSHYESDWQVGGRTLFLDKSGQNGMLSTIELLNPPYEVVFKHLGLLQNGKEILGTKEVMEWSGSMEKYRLIELEGYTKLHCATQTQNEHKPHLLEGFKKGFSRIKELAENKGV